MEIGADLLRHLDDLPGLYVGFHQQVTPGVRIHVGTGRPVTPEPGPLDRVALALGGEVTAFRQAGLALHAATGAWRGIPVRVAHLSAERDPDDPIATRPAREVADAIDRLLPAVRRIDPAVLATVLVRDRDGALGGHLVLESDHPLDTLTRAAEGLPLFVGRTSPCTAFGALLTSTGLPVTVVSQD